MNPDDDSPRIPDQLEDAFGVLASEPRLEILFALLDQGTLNPLTFSELHEQVGTVDTGRLNYHLKQLTGRFIARTEEGYRLQFSAIAVCRSMMAALGSEQPQIEPFDLDSTCPDCGAMLSAGYDHEHVIVRCPDCDAKFHTFPFPPGTLLERTPEAVLESYDQWQRAHITLASNGLCLWCFGQMTPEIVIDESHSIARAMIEYECNRCSGDVSATVGESLLAHPAVVSFYHDHGIDLSRKRSWNLDFLWDDELVTVESEEPRRMRLTIPLDDEVLELTIDGDVNVLTETRQQRST